MPTDIEVPPLVGMTEFLPCFCYKDQHQIPAVHYHLASSKHASDESNNFKLREISISVKMTFLFDVLL